MLANFSTNDSKMIFWKIGFFYFFVFYSFANEGLNLKLLDNRQTRSLEVFFMAWGQNKETAILSYNKLSEYI